MVLKIKHKKRLIENLCQVVRIPSRSSPSGGEEGELQLLVAKKMKELGARVRIFEADDIPEFLRHPLCCGPERNYRNRPTVIGELGPDDGPALMVLAHSDTVPVNQPEKWTFDPFCGAVRPPLAIGLFLRQRWGISTTIPEPT